MSGETSPTSGVLETGQLIGGRFLVERIAAEDSLGVLAEARDEKGERRVFLRILAAPALVSTAVTESLREGARAIADVEHPVLLATYGVGTDSLGRPFVASEYIDGQVLAKTILERERADAGGFSLRAAYSLVSHVARLLEASPVPHGALRPSAIIVSRTGRVKVAELGLAQTYLRNAGATTTAGRESLYLAPEVIAGLPPNARSDVFGLAAIMRAMLTGRIAVDLRGATRTEHEQLSPELDDFLALALEAEPAARPPDARTFRETLEQLVGPEEGPSGELDIPVDLASEPPRPPAPGPGDHVSRAAGAPPRPAKLPSSAGQVAAAAAAQARSAKPPVPRAPPAPPTADSPRVSNPGAPPIPGARVRPKVGERVSIHEPFRPSAVSVPHGGPEPIRASAVDLSSLVQKITENDSARWMVQKDGLDHGPFSGRELVQLILKGDVLSRHSLVNLDTGERRGAESFPDFSEFFEQYKIVKADADQKAAVARSTTVEKRTTTAKALIGGVVVLGLLAGAVWFYMSRKEQARAQLASAEMAASIERGELRITGNAGLLPEPPRRRNGGGGRRAGGGGGGGAGANGSYEEAMNQVVNLGSAVGSGGEQTLRREDIAGVMDRRLNSLFGCVTTELRAGHQLGNVVIDMAIAGNGHVLGASVRAGSPQFQSCIQQRVRAITFPTFSAPRMGARYSFNVD